MDESLAGGAKRSGCQSRRHSSPAVGILRAAHRHAVVPARDADIAADALANLVLPALVDLVRQKRVRDRGPCAPDQIEYSAPYLRDHHVGRSEAADSHHRPPGQLLHEIDDGLVASLGREPRGRAIGGAGIHLDVPKIRDVGEQSHHFVRFGRRIAARPAAQLFHADSQRDGAFVADRIARHLQHLAHQAHSILDRAAVGVGTPVVFGQQELIGQVAHAGVDVDDVESGLHGAPRAGGLPAKQILDVVAVHGRADADCP